LQNSKQQQTTHAAVGSEQDGMGEPSGALQCNFMIPGTHTTSSGCPARIIADHRGLWWQSELEPPWDLPAPNITTQSHQSPAGC